ncbi:MAG: NAD-dependent epimerase/dehydratase family protein [Porticoccaceae bacterium]|jgi:nucleoside-diphosphate-sugar epimerase|nr:NAD-dependent epimerase/dehydratase family protein [Porticoccaceae bacterium]HLS98335.1 NAD-dependent epimerase/dehydratase family protein [Porticoccaceae bacterium]
MRVLVFGASGYLGSHLVDHFVARGDEVTGFSRNPGAPPRHNPNCRYVHGDLLEGSSFAALLNGADVVIQAAQLNLDPEREAIAAMVESLRGSGKTFIMTSGTGVLSQRTDGDWSEDSFAEDDPFVPSKYIGARLDTENLVRAAAGDGIRAMVVRPPLIWGNGGCPVIGQLHQSATATGAVCYVGRGLNLYSNVHVEDLARVYALAVDRGQPGALYHAVSGELNYRCLAEAVADCQGVPTRAISLGEAIELWGKFAALVAFASCSRSRSPRTRRELGWRPDPSRLDIRDDIDHPNYRGQVAP